MYVEKEKNEIEIFNCKLHSKKEKKKSQSKS